MKQFLSAVILVMASLITAHSQQTVRYDDPEASYYLGLELFNKEKYSAAKEIFSHIVTTINDNNSGIRVSSEYYEALCAYELSNNDAKYLLEQFIMNHPESSGVQHAYFQLGKIYYRDKDYRDALAFFKKTDIRQLTNKEVAEYYFRKGYSHMKEKQYKEAREAFFEIIDTESEYTNQATFYYSHIAYMENDLETAVTGFNKIKDDPEYSDIIPYYLMDIYYLQGNYDEVIGLSGALLADENNKRNSEISRIVAESYFKIGKYSEALPWFEAYFAEEKGKTTRQDYFQIGYCYYQTSGYDKAAEALQKVTGPADSLSQSAFYHLGSCYINKDQKKFAQSAFLSAYKLGFDNEIKENALFNYAKLSYELTYDPYNEAIKALRQYIADYPDSKRTDEAYSYLVDLFISTKNYREALETIDKIKTKDNKMLAAYQKITYYRGIEIFNDRDYFEAIKMFRKSLDNNYDKIITALDNYWIGESYYRLSSFEFAQEYYKKFQALPAASQTDVFKRNAYDMGYSLYMQKKYGEAVTYFQKYINQSSAEPALITDACLRIGDSHFIDKKYDDAIAFYDKAIQRGGTGSDYAMYQKALAVGGKGDFARKASLLLDFLRRFEKSVYAEDAIYELATTSLILNKDDQALTYFKLITDKYPSSRHVKKSLLKLGLIYFNRDNNDLAISSLKKVIQDYPGSVESKEALESLRDIYTDMNRVDEYFAFASQFPFADLSVSQQDSLTYIANENLYMNGDCEKASAGFSEYLKKYLGGVFTTNASYYAAECALKANDPEKALQGYEFVISQPSSGFTENALAKAAAILFGLHRNQEALDDYTNLESVASRESTAIVARTGQMRCNFLLGNYEAAMHSADNLITRENAGNELTVEAYFIRAKSALELNDKSGALEAFKKTCAMSQNEMAAESQYYIAFILYENEDYQESEKQTFLLVNKYPSYDYWVAKGFILLADIYVKLNNVFQAKQTLQSILDNYEGEDIKAIAREKLDSLNNMEITPAEDVDNKNE